LNKYSNVNTTTVKESGEKVVKSEESSESLSDVSANLKAENETKNVGNKQSMNILKESSETLKRTGVVGGLVKEVDDKSATRTSGFTNENVLSKEDFKILNISKGKLNQIYENRDIFTKVKSKNAYDEMVENLIKVQRKREVGEALTDSDETVLEYAGFSLSTDEKTISEKIKDCISVSQDIRELSKNLSQILYEKTELLGNLRVQEANKFETELTKSLYENIYQMNMANDSQSILDKISITETISNAIPESIATQEEITQSLTTLAVAGLKNGEESVNIFKAIKEFTQNNSYGYGFNDINAIVSEANERANAQENVSNSSTVRSLKNLGYKAEQQATNDIDKKSFYSLLAKSTVESCGKIGVIKDIPVSYEDVHDMSSCLKFLSTLESPRINETTLELSNKTDSDS
jgi:hypothetical protein